MFRFLNGFFIERMNDDEEKRERVREGGRGRDSGFESRTVTQSLRSGVSAYGNDDRFKPTIQVF